MLPTILSASFGDPSAFALGLIRYPAGQKLNFNLNNEKIKPSTVIKLSVDTLTVRSFFQTRPGKNPKGLGRLPGDSLPDDSIPCGRGQGKVRFVNGAGLGNLIKKSCRKKHFFSLVDLQKLKAPCSPG